MERRAVLLGAARTISEGGFDTLPDQTSHHLPDETGADPTFTKSPASPPTPAAGRAEADFIPSPANRGGGTNRLNSPRRRKHRFFMNTTAIAITALVVLASLFWISSVAVYRVVSSSMEPAIQGTSKWGDRLLCWKLAYLRHPPRRWEVAMFNAPERAREQSNIPNLTFGSEKGPTVKRVAGLPGEWLAILEGDIWTKPLGSQSPYSRQIKPDSVQQGMWIGVYDEDFSDLSVDEFLFFWNRLGEGTLSIAPDRTLVIQPDAGGESGIGYQVRVRADSDGKRMRRISGIPDRYVLEQDVTFACRTPGCDGAFSAHVHNQKIQARCPVCGVMAFEDSVVYYDRRSGLPEIGSDPVSSGQVGQGDPAHIRMNYYHMVPDLKIALEFKLLRPDSECRLVIVNDDDEIAAGLDRSGASVNGAAAAPMAGMADKDGWIRAEFYTLDGAVRLFLGPERKLAFELPAWRDSPPDYKKLFKRTSVNLMAGGGGVAVRNLAIDRDIYYFSGRELGYGFPMGGVSKENEIAIDGESFFPLGDNCTVSLDGRSWGPVSLDLLKGKAVWILKPDERAGRIPSP